MVPFFFFFFSVMPLILGNHFTPFTWDCSLCVFGDGVLTCPVVGRLFRRILIFPKGNNVDYLSMYLDVADSVTLPYGWSRYAQFSLAVVNQIHYKYSIRKGILHCSCSGFKGCAFLFFCHLRFLF